MHISAGKQSYMKLRCGICLLLILAMLFAAFSADIPTVSAYYAASLNGKYIKWVDFSVSSAALKQAIKYDTDSFGTDTHIDFISLLSYAALYNGGKFSKKQDKNIDKCADRLKNGESTEDICGDSKYYKYYYEAYSAVLGGFLGEYSIECYDENTDNHISVQKRYGLRVFSPIAKGFGYSHSDDFGVSRSYGFARTHLGNDLMGTVGTPIIAVEDGIIENMGWNKYGGWRIGIRSLDFKRYYYYAHLRRGHPYVQTLKEGMEVKAGDVIGYLGMTGYSDTEDYNGMNVPHLHFGMQLIFDESQVEGNNEIWIDVYEIVELLSSYRSAVDKNEQTGDWQRRYNFV